MFSPEDRQRLSDELLSAAAEDPRITGGAITGSASIGKLDAWSDVDLAFGVRGEIAAVLNEFTNGMYGHYGAVHHVDVHSGAWIYRVFLLDNTLQVDLAFAPEAEFGARAPTFKLVFGEAAQLPPPSKPDAEQMIGMAWLYALHVRSSLRREKVLQAEYMLHGMRDQVLALACLRHDLPTSEGRGFDQLPEEIKQGMLGLHPKSLGLHELHEAFSAATAALMDEAKHQDEKLLARLRKPLEELAHPTSDSPIS